MSIMTYGSTVSKTVSILRDVCIDEANGNAVVVESQSNRIFRYSLTTPYAQVGSDTSTGVSGGLSAVTLINSASAYFASSTSSATSVGLMELTSGYAQLYNVGTARGTRALGRAQQAAGDPSSGIAFSTTNTARTLVKMTASTFTASQPTILNMQTTSEFANCILLKEAGRWLVGSNLGKVYEIDSSANVIEVTCCNYAVGDGIDPFIAPTITGISYSNNILAVTTFEGFFQLYNYKTKDLLYSQKFGDSATSTDGTVSNNGGLSLCAAVSGFVMLGHNYTTGNSGIVAMADITRTDWPIREILYTGSTSTTPSYALSSTGAGIFLRTTVGSATQSLAMFSFIPDRDVIGGFSSMQYPTGTAVAGRVIRIIDDGVGSDNTQVLLDTTIDSGGQTLPVTRHKNIIEIVLTDTGTNQAGHVSEYSS